MIEISNKHFLAVVILSVLVFAGYSLTNLTPSIKTGEKTPAETEQNKTAGDSGDKNLTEEKSRNVSKKRVKEPDTVRILPDGSQYVLMKDTHGNKTEYRYFEPSTEVKYISLNTLADGTTSLLLRTWEGSIRKLPVSLLTSPWGSTAREIAILTGVSPEPKGAPQAQFTPPLPLIASPSPAPVKISPQPKSENVQTPSQIVLGASEKPSPKVKENEEPKTTVGN